MHARNAKKIIKKNTYIGSRRSADQFVHRLNIFQCDLCANHVPPAKAACVDSNDATNYISVH